MSSPKPSRFVQHLGVNIVCVKRLVGSGEWFDCQFYVSAAPGVVAPIRFFPSLHWELVLIFVDRVDESVIEIKLCQMLSREEGFHQPFGLFAVLEKVTWFALHGSNALAHMALHVVPTFCRNFSTLALLTSSDSQFVRMLNFSINKTPCCSLRIFSFNGGQLIR